jgi:hypothetical protein
MAWVLLETVLGAVREHINECGKKGFMGLSKTNLALSIVIGLIFILPFATLAFIFDGPFRDYGFSPRAIIDRLVIFGFIWIPVTGIAWIVMPVLRNKIAPAVSREGKTLPLESSSSGLISSPKVSAFISLLLAAPFLILFSMFLLKIQPPDVITNLVPQVAPDQPNILGAVFMLGIHLLAIAACLIARAPIVRTTSAGGSILAHPLNLLLITVILSIIATGVLFLMADQFPCWIGVPNCD